MLPFLDNYCNKKHFLRDFVNEASFVLYHNSLAATYSNEIWQEVQISTSISVPWGQTSSLINN